MNVGRDGKVEIQKTNMDPFKGIEGEMPPPLKELLRPEEIFGFLDGGFFFRIPGSKKTAEVEKEISLLGIDFSGKGRVKLSKAGRTATLSEETKCQADFSKLENTMKETMMATFKKMGLPPAEIEAECKGEDKYVPMKATCVFDSSKGIPVEISIKDFGMPIVFRVKAQIMGQEKVMEMKSESKGSINITWEEAR